MSEFRMPSLGADMEFGTLLEWLVKPGDTVKRGDIVAVVDTSKAEIEVEIFEDGVIEELLVPEHTRVPVGTALATLRPLGARAPAAPPAAPPPAEPPQPHAPPHPHAPSFAGLPSPQAHRPRVSPLARRTAEELGVELAELHGTGPEGAITRDDVQRAAGKTPAQPPGAAAAAEVPAAEAPPRPARGAERKEAMREAIGALMARSKREVPHYYLQHEIDMGRALAWLEEENERRELGARLISSVLLLRAVARAAADTPAMNGFWLDGGFQPAQAVHLGVAVAQRGGGLIAPALRDAGAMSLDETMTGLRELVARVRGGRLRAGEMSDSTITVTNLGDGGVDAVHGVIYPPQVALVGFGGIRDRPRAVDGLLGVGPTVIATLAADHRVSDGRAGSRFLSLIDELLQRPEEL